MSVEIISTDNSSGTSYNGVWNFTASLRGNYNILYQYIDTQAIPFMWSDNNKFVISITDGIDTVDMVITLATSMGLLTNLSTFASQMQTNIQSSFNTLGITFPALFRTVTVGYNSTTKLITMTFSANVSLKYEATFTTINNVIDKFTNEDNATVFTWPTFHMTTTPKYLYYKITESVSQCNTTSSSSFSPTFVLSTSDFSVTNQNIYFLAATKTLTIKIYRQNDTDHIVPLTNQWSVILN